MKTTSTLTEPDTTTTHVCCSCGRRFRSVDCLAAWCDRCVLHATQGRSARQVVANERIAAWTWGSVGLFVVGVVLAWLAGGL